MHSRSLVNYSLNFSSAILLIYLSKWLFRRYAISSLTLTIFNCFLCGILSTIALKFFLQPSTNTSISTNRFRTVIHRILIAGSFSAFIAFSNFSLQYNTIGTYQLIKLQVPPTLMIIEWIQLRFKLNSPLLTKEKFSQDYSSTVLLAFSIIVFGTLINTYSDLYFHPLGVLYACISVISNAFYQSLVQGDKSLASYERIRFLQNQSILSTILLMMFYPSIESPPYINWYLFEQSNLLILIFLCGILAFIVNTSVIWCIQDDTAIGYNMIGQLKTLIIIFVGSGLFGELLTIKQIISILFTTAGCFFYAYVKYKNKERQRSQLLPMNNS